MKIASISLLVLALAVSQANPLWAEDPATVNTDGTKGAKNSDQRVVCHTEKELGSLLRTHRNCMTVSQWREVRDQSGRATERKEVQTMMRGGD